MVLLQAHDGHRLGLVLLHLRGDGDTQSLHSLLTADRGRGKACFHVLVLTNEALQRHADLCLPAALGTGRRCVKLWQGVLHTGHLLAKHFTVAPGDKAVNKRERIDGPSGVVFDFSLVSTKHPVACLVHFQDDDARCACALFKRTQCGGEGGDCWQICRRESCEI